MTSASYDFSMAGIPPPSLLRRLAQSLAEEFDYLLHWDLPISTMVEFNEVGRSPYPSPVLLQDAPQEGHIQVVTQISDSC